MVAMLIPAGGGATMLGGGQEFKNAWAFIAADLRRLRRLAGEAVVSEGGRLRQALVADTSQGLGPRMARTWLRPKTYTGPPPVVKAVVVGNRAPHIVYAHDQPGITIRPNAGSRLARLGATPRSSHRMLAIPTGNAGQRGTGRFSNQPMTPGVYEQIHHTQLVRVGNVLIDPHLKVKGGRQARARGPQTLSGAVVFVLVPQVSLGQRLHTEAVGKLALDRLLSDIAGEFTEGGA